MHKFDFPKAKNDVRTVETLLKEKLNGVEGDPIFREALLRKILRNNESPRRSLFDVVLGVLTGAPSVWAGAATVLVIGIGITASYSYSSPGVTRLSNLYFMKRFLESVELTMAPTNLGEAKKHLKFSERRLEEAKELSEQGVIDTPTIEEATKQINAAMEATEAIGSPSKRREAEENLRESSRKGRNEISGLVEKLEDKENDVKVIEEPRQPEPDQSSQLSNGIFEISNEVPLRFDLPPPAAKPPSQEFNEEPDSRDVVIFGTINTLRNKADDLQKVEISSSEEDSPFKEMRITGASGLPDIVVKIDSLTKSAEAGETVTLIVKLINEGSAGSMELPLSIKWGDNSAEQLPARAIEPSKWHTITFTHEYRDPGSYKVIVRLNPENKGIERNYANNVASATVTVSPSPSRPVQPPSAAICGDGACAPGEAESCLSDCQLASPETRVFPFDKPIIK